MSQHVLQHVFGIPTPLGIATAYHIFNQTRSKSQVVLDNRIGIGISYERLQRQLTTQSVKAMQQVETDGVYVPETMTKTAKFPMCLPWTIWTGRRRHWRVGVSMPLLQSSLKTRRLRGPRKLLDCPLPLQTKERLSLMLMTHLFPNAISQLNTGRRLGHFTILRNWRV